MDFVKFPDIEGFHNVIKLLEAYPHFAESPVAYRTKIKLHGTNAGVRIVDGEIAAQSRELFVTPENDNAGFAKWVESRKDFFSKIPGNHTVFGEWCGPGTVKKSDTAISNIQGKVFVVFAIMGTPTTNPKIEDGNIDLTDMFVDPDAIAEFLGKLPEDVFILPWHSEPVVVDFNSPASVQAIVDAGNKAVSDVEPCDPWVKKTFGVEGTGEGVVYYPTSGPMIIRKRFSNFAFKAKGDKHKVVKTKEAVQIAPEIAASIEEFVTLFVTEPRLEQAASVVKTFEKKNMGPFLQWISSDVLKESKAELEASGLTWDQVQKGVQTAAKTWFLTKVI